MSGFSAGFSSDRLLERLKGKKIFPTNVLASEEPWVARVGPGVEVFESMSDSFVGYPKRGESVRVD